MTVHSVDRKQSEYDAREMGHQMFLMRDCLMAIFVVTAPILRAPTVGGSVAFGQGAADDASSDARIETRLAKRHEGIVVEAFNLGVHRGYDGTSAPGGRYSSRIAGGS